MCGIFGYVGNTPAASRVLHGLRRLEYRGYDSAGVCVNHPTMGLQTYKAVGRVSNLEAVTTGIDLSASTIGIGHTRWATHGGVTEKNCHPHQSYHGRFSVVHNGIVENYAELKDELRGEGISFVGETDSEVAVNEFEKIYDGDIFSSLTKLRVSLEGAYAFVFLDRDNPNVLFGAKVGSPLSIGIGKDGYYVGSDYRSFSGYADEYVALEDGDIFVIERDKGYSIRNAWSSIERSCSTIDIEDHMEDKGEYPHFMLKEVFEQPQVLNNVFAGRVDFSDSSIKNRTLDELFEKWFERVTVVASGTSFHSGLMGKKFFEEFARMPTDVIVSTEFKYGNPFIDTKTLYIFVSQSGETADTLESLKLVKERGGYTFGIVNVPGSSIARMSDSGFFTHAGAEIGVASTKAFMAQMATFLVMGLYFGNRRGMDYLKSKNLIAAMEMLPGQIDELLRTSEAIRLVAEDYKKYLNFFYLGRTFELPIASEGSLKLKELTYRHSEAYSSGELKHGSLALIDTEFPSILLNANGPLRSKNHGSAQEVRSRGGKVIGIIDQSDESRHWYDDVLTFPSVPYELAPFLEVVVLQLFAYHVAVGLDRDVDRPRNLAKSVTVE